MTPDFPAAISDPATYLLSAIVVIALLSLRRTWVSTDNAGGAYERGHEASEVRHRAEIDKLRDEFHEQMSGIAARHERELAGIERRHQSELDEMRQHVERLYEAIAELLPMVRAERQADAAALVIGLGSRLPRFNEKDVT